MNSLRLLGATALASTLLVSSVAVAQLAPTTPPKEDATPSTLDEEQRPTSSQGGEQADSKGDVIVTGSRIRRNQYNTADPVNIVSFDQATQAGFVSTAQVLQSAAISNGTAQINNSYGGFVTAGGPGANTLSLRGFGTTRSLALLNGRRLSPSGARGSVGSVDLTYLPNIMVDRIEILNGGASSIYGSDAIAGVVNLITRSNFKGILLDAQVNVPEIGAGRTERYGALFGYQGERLRLVGSVEYLNREAVQYGDVKFARCQTSYRKLDANSAPGSADFIDPLTGQPKCYPTGVTGESGVTINTIGTPAFNGQLVDRAPGVPAGYGALPASAGFGSVAAQTCNRFRPDPTAAGAVPGFECVGGGVLALGIRDTFPLSLYANEIVNGGENYNGFLQASYDIDALGGAEVYGELLLNRRKSEQNGNRQFTIDYPFGSPLIPTNLRFAAPALGAQATNPGVQVGIRVFADYGIYNNRQTVDFVRALGGIRGEIGGGWHYDAYFLRSWSDADYTSDLILTDKLNQSLDVVAAPGGGFQCRSNVSGCVAAPALTPAVVGGQFPAAWLGYVVSPVTGTTKFRESIASAVVDGPLFDIWGGPVQLAVGVEYRKQKIDDTPGLDSQRSNLYGFTSSTITRGSDNVKEIFGELEVPVLRERPFFHDLTLKGSARYTDYKSYGSQTTWKAGGIYSPTRWLSARGSYGTSYRAPGLFEQFLGATTGFQAGSSDPCNNLGAAGQNPVRVANCRSEGLPDGFQQNSSITVLQRGGAESGLTSEDSKAYTFGGVFQPSFGEWGRLSLSADYFNIKVSGGVSQLGFGTILQQCYDDPDFRAESICALAVRNAQNQLTVTTGFVNISTAKVTGIDFNGRYSVTRGDTAFDIGGQVTRFGKRYNQTLPSDPIDDNIGSLNNPRWSGVFDGGVTYDKVTFRYSAEWLGKTNSTADYLGLTQAARDTYVFNAKDYWIHSASIRYRLDEKFQFTFGVRNIFEQNLPQISSGAYNRVGNVPLYSGYDYVGRTFFANVRAGF